MTWGAPPSMTATHEFVVPRSIPISLPNYPPQLTRVPLVYSLPVFPGFGSLRDLDEGGPEETVLQEVPFSEDFHDRSFLGPRDDVVAEGLMEFGVVAFSHGILDLEAHPFEGHEELTSDEGEPLSEGGFVGLGALGAIQVVEGRDERLDGVREGILEGLLAVALHSLAIVLEIGSAPEELILEVVALGFQGGDVRRGRGEGLERSRLALGAPILVVHRDSVSACRTCRATWSTRAMTLAYSIRVEPMTPTPTPPSSSTGHETRAIWERPGSGFSWPITTRRPLPEMQAVRILTRRPFSSKVRNRARSRPRSSGA